MGRVAVVTDSTAYLPRELIERHGIHVVPLYVVFGGDRPVPEIEITDYAAFFEELRSADKLPTTSQPSVGDFLEVYEPLLQAGHDIVSIHLAAGLSGTCESARAAKTHLAERGRPGTVEVIDSATACGGVGLVALAAAAEARAAGDLQAVVARVRRAREQLALWFCIDTMEYLRRGGRVGAARAWVGSTLKIKPILSVESEITPVERVRTARRAFERMVDYMRSRHDDGADGWVVQHIQASEQAERLVAHGREIFATEPLFVSEVGPVIGTHVGPGLLGVGGIPAALVR